MLLGACALHPPAPSLAGESSSTSVANDDAPGLPLDLGASQDEAPSRAGGLFLEEPDGGIHGDCPIFEQDCPAGEKCNVYSIEGSYGYEARKCVPIVPDPDDIGESCTFVGGHWSGLDTCVLGGTCWDVDPETNVGVCVAFCKGSEANPTCVDPTMHCVGRDLMICLPSCCPLEQDCGEGQACYPVGDSFWCAPDVSGDDGGGFGDACEFINVCDPGFFCAGSELVPECAGSSGCCTAYCEIGSSCTALHPDLDCIPWFEEGHAPFGEEHVGGCMLPE